MKHGAQTKGTGAAAGVGAAFEQLDGVLRALLQEHQQLLALAGEHREAIAGADGKGLALCMAKQQQVAQRIGGLERQRQAIVAVIVRGVGGAGVATVGGQPLMSALTAKAPEPVRGRLASVAAALKELLHKVHMEHRAIRAAAEMLSAHMEGLVRQACQQMSHAGTYERYGSVGNTVQVVSAVDVRS